MPSGCSARRLAGAHKIALAHEERSAHNPGEQGRVLRTAGQGSARQALLGEGAVRSSRW